MSERTIAHDVEAIATELIGKDHPHLMEQGTAILYVKSDQDKASKGKTVKAEIVSLGGTAAWLSSFIPGAEAEYDFMLTVYGSAWDGLTAEQRQACVDRELCKLVEKTVQHADGETTVIKLQDYDVKGFSANIKRYGLWEAPLRTFAATAKQLPLDMAAVQVDLAAEAQQKSDATAQTEGTADDGEGEHVAGDADSGPENEGDSEAIGRIQREGARRRAANGLSVVGG